LVFILYHKIIQNTLSIIPHLISSTPQSLSDSLFNFCAPSILSTTIIYHEQPQRSHQPGNLDFSISPPDNPYTHRALTDLKTLFITRYYSLLELQIRASCIYLQHPHDPVIPLAPVSSCRSVITLYRSPFYVVCCVFSSFL